MIEIAKFGSWLGGALLLFGLFAGLGALSILSIMGLVKAFSGDPTSIPSKSVQVKSNSDGVVASWLAWLVFAVFAILAFFGEMFTRFSDAGFGYIYITLGMPAYLVTWLALNICASVRSVPTKWLF